MSKGKVYWTIKEALCYAGELGVSLTPPTIRRYCKEFNLGHRVPNIEWGRWQVHIIKFKNFLKGEFNAENSSSSSNTKEEGQAEI